ncbi:MAG TPA: DUF1127 domain-containing protein [Xanthobacteraceae bacterium]|nr:DUF1127 domain-containing protein [Xanthobacteraceae bacterium]
MRAGTVIAVPRLRPRARQRAPRSLIAVLREWRRRIRSRRELAAISERSLRDIGLTRYDADFETRKPFWRA